MIIGLLFVGGCFLDANGYVDLSTEFAFIMNGFILIALGIFGLLNHEISLRNAKPIEYNKNSIIGKIVNIIIIFIGVVSFVFGCIY